MFFKKKTSPPIPTTRAEQRAQYRKRNSKSQTLEAHLLAPGWESLRVELIDLSVRGSCIRIPFAKDRNLKVDDLVELSIGSMMRNEVKTTARVANIAREGETHIRYGLQFLNVENLYAQLDAFYARHFNRRRHVRVLPSLDRKVQVKLHWCGEEVSGHVFDISESGIGVTLTKDSSARIAEVQKLELALKLPGVEGVLGGSATVRSRTPMSQHTLVSLEFDLDAADGFGQNAATLAKFVERRVAEMTKWEQSWE
jgi:c-di-GMP-binding flagellar brake protein YcgR